jgi:hypothetical protein
MKPMYSKLKILLAIIAGLTLTTSCGIFKSAANFQDELAQKMATIEGKYQISNDGVYIQKVIETSGTKDDIYVRLLEFLTRTYNDANEVVQVKEKEEGLIVCKGCHRFNVNDFLYGSAIEETAWHIYKAEVKDGRVRVTITLDEMDWYRPASAAGGVYISSAKGTYSILECPPIKRYDNKEEHVRKGYVFYYAVSNLVALMQATEEALSNAPAYKVDDNW